MRFRITALNFRGCYRNSFPLCKGSCALILHYKAVNKGSINIYFFLPHTRLQKYLFRIISTLELQLPFVK